MPAIVRAGPDGNCMPSRFPAWGTDIQVLGPGMCPIKELYPKYGVARTQTGTLIQDICTSQAGSY